MRKFAIIIALLMVTFSASAQMILSEFPDVRETSTFRIDSESIYVPSLDVSAAIIGESDETDRLYLIVRIHLDYEYADIPQGSVLLIRTADDTVIDVTNQPPREDIHMETLYGAAFYGLTLEQFESIGKGVTKLRMQYDKGVLELTNDDYNWGALVRRFMATVRLTKEYREEKRQAEENQAYLNSLQDIREGF